MKLVSPSHLHKTMIVDNRPPESRVNANSELEGKEKPPPYSPGAPPRLPRRPNAGSSSAPDGTPLPSVNQLHLQTGPDPIIGTFYIDPKIPSLGFDAKGKKGRKKNPPHASFRTRQGAISLDLATTGNVSEAAKAWVLVASRTGNVKINLLATPSTRPRIGLEVFSRKGDIVLFLPKTFAGVIQLNTRKGSLQFLPALASIMRVLKNSDREALVLVGNQSMSKSGLDDTQAVDFCQLDSRCGKVIVGLSGQDKYEEKVGFWKKLGSALLTP